MRFMISILCTLFISFTMFSQDKKGNYTVSGNVKDALNEVLPYATVVLQNTEGLSLIHI